MIDVARTMYGADNVTVLDSGRGESGGEPCIRCLLDVQAFPINSMGPMIQYVVHFVRNRYLYTASVLYSKPLYQQYASLVKQIGDSFTFPAAANTTLGSVKQRSGDRTVTFTWPKESWGVSLLKAYGTVLLKVLVVSMLLAAGSAVWVKVTGKKKGAEKPTQSTNRDEE